MCAAILPDWESWGQVWGWGADVFTCPGVIMPQRPQRTRCRRLGDTNLGGQPTQR